MSSEPKAKKLKTSSLFEVFQDERLKTADSILSFKLNKKRVKVISSNDEVLESASGILYWMFREGRVQDNWSFLFAQKTALKYKVPLHVCYCILPTFLDATVRHYKFLIRSLQEVEKDCNDLNIKFHLLKGEPNDVVVDLIKKYNMGAMICDFFPLRLPRFWLDDIKKKLPKNVPICQVDGHNIVPCWVASDKLEYGARTIRNKINSKLDEFLTQFPPLIKHPHTTEHKFEKTNWDTVLDDVKIDKTIEEVDWITPGYRGAVAELQNFIENRLKNYDTKRNDPTVDALSNLSPWFHFGQISVQRVILEVKKYKSKYPNSVAAFMEESIIRRELSDNFCFHNEKYDSVEGANEWAIKSLDLHRKDKREYLYTLEEFENAQTHDDLWNAAQLQLVKIGKIHGFMRMYWAKKILEWTTSPEEALKWAIYLNDRYSMDGRDPNGYVGCMWSVCGIHDQGWKERDVFGKIRFMNYAGCKRKFDVAEYVRKWGGKVHNKKPINSFFKKTK